MTDFEEEFFARLANVEDLERLAEEEKTGMLDELERVMPSVVELVRSWTLGRGLGFTLTPPTEEERFKLWGLLQVTHAQVQRCLLGLVAGKEVALPVAVEIRGHVKDRQFVEEMKPKNEEELVFSTFLRVLRRKPFPFGQCEVCHKVFVQEVKGKPKRYCSERCQGKGIPSAAKRARYVHAWRQRTREQEVERVATLVREVPAPQLWEALHRELPLKSRRELLALIRQATSQAGENVTAREEEQKTEMLPKASQHVEQRIRR